MGKPACCCVQLFERSMMKISHNLGVLLVTALLGGCFSAPVVSQQNTRSESVAVQQKQAKVYSATVSRVSDGDSLQVIDQHGQKRKLRFAYIDAPELQQAHGEASRKALQDVLGKQVEVTVFGRDRYRRELVKVSVAGRDLSLRQLQQGHAWHYQSYAKRDQAADDYAAYAAAQQQAKQNRIGLWRAREAQAPWAFRQQNRQGETAN